MSFTMDDLSDDAVTPRAETGPAELGGVKGRGTLQVVRGAQGEVTEVSGTWHLAAGQAGGDLRALEDAHEQGSPVVYEGRLDDHSDPERTEINIQVLISSIGHYTLDAPRDGKTPEDRAAEPELRFFNFHPQEEWADASQAESDRQGELPQDPE
ncbi:hypothetical protein BH24DEI2_BH24DEI2_13440 [soil metagenome]